MFEIAYLTTCYPKNVAASRGKHHAPLSLILVIITTAVISQEKETTLTNPSRVEDAKLESHHLSPSYADAALALTAIWTSTPGLMV